MHQELLHRLTQLEVLLHQNNVRHDAAQVASLLHDEFIEFGRSGRTYTKIDQVTSLAQEPPLQIWAQDFLLKPLADDVCLLTYRSAQMAKTGQLERFSLRSSLWKRTDQGWQIIFHQGTPTEPFAQSMKLPG